MPIRVAAAAAGARRTDRAMGVPVSIMRVPGTVVTEVDAFQMLSGAQATPLAAGGLNEAGGAVVLALRGEKDQIEKALDLVNGVKGTPSPPIELRDCVGCPREGCHFNGRAQDALRV